jgi:hypothetical protein
MEAKNHRLLSLRDQGKFEICERSLLSFSNSSSSYTNLLTSLVISTLMPSYKHIPTHHTARPCFSNQLQAHTIPMSDVSNQLQAHITPRSSTLLALACHTQSREHKYKHTTLRTAPGPRHPPSQKSQSPLPTSPSPAVPY